jgi:hypothetical protein
MRHISVINLLSLRMRVPLEKMAVSADQDVMTIVKVEKGDLTIVVEVAMVATTDPGGTMMLNLLKVVGERSLTEAVEVAEVAITIERDHPERSADLTTTMSDQHVVVGIIDTTMKEETNHLDRTDLGTTMKGPPEVVVVENLTLSRMHHVMRVVVSTEDLLEMTHTCSTAEVAEVASMKIEDIHLEVVHHSIKLEVVVVLHTVNLAHLVVSEVHPEAVPVC